MSYIGIFGTEKGLGFRVQELGFQAGMRYQKGFGA